LGGRRARADSFARHLEPLQGSLEAYCRRSLHDRGGVADVLQSAIANAYRDFDLYVEGTNFRAWIFRYVHLEILNANRKSARGRHEPLPADLSIEEAWQFALDEPLQKALLDDPEKVLEQCDALVAQAVLELAPLERAVLLLTAIAEFKYREIAEILQVPIGTVMSSLSRGRLRLRQRLVQYAQEHGYLRSKGHP
jgi:RNA polymerase sigma-70 factor (ECF subfamily)